MDERFSDIPTPGEIMGAWVVTPEPPDVYVFVECIGCGYKSRIKVGTRANKKTRMSCPECPQNQLRRERNGLTLREPLYKVWVGMRHRCQEKNVPRIKKIYFDKGITVCDEWLDPDTGLDDFIAWANANGYAKGLELDRRDNARGYSPDNCRFVTRQVNNNNRDTSRRITAWGESKTIPEWLEDERCAVTSYGLLYERVFPKKGHNLRPWTPEDAISTPRRSRSRWSS